jgi:hypothetical protein
VFAIDTPSSECPDCRIPGEWDSTNYGVIALCLLKQGRMASGDSFSEAAMGKAMLCSALILALVPAGWCQQVATEPHSAQSAAKVIILPPQVTFEQLEAKAHPKAINSVEFESALTNAATTNLAARRYAPTAPAGLQNDTAAGLLRQLQPLTSRLARGSINDDAQQILSKLAGLPEDFLILVQFVRVRQGPGGSWSPISGAITSGASSTSMQAALISTRTGQVTWKNEVLERSMFSADSPKFAKCIEQLYSTLAFKGEHQ